MIIQQNTKYINNEDKEKLDLLSENFKLFRKHNEKLSYGIDRILNEVKTEYVTTIEQVKNKYTLSNNQDEYQTVRTTVSKDIYKNKLIIKGKRLSSFYSPSKQKRLKTCNTWAEFAKFLDGKQELKQTKSNACGVHLLCPFCASRKASKIQKRLEDFFMLFDDKLSFYDNSLFDDKFNVSDIINNEFEFKASQHTLDTQAKVKSEYGNILSDKYYWYFSVLTVKNSFDINQVLNHLKHSFTKLRKKINDYKKRNSDTVFTSLGGVYSVEITYNYKTGYHPHINFLWCSDKKIQDIKLYKSKKQKSKISTSLYFNSDTVSKEWLSITKDSFITSCTPINIKKDLKKNLMEIIKYALKFNDMPISNLLEIYPHLHKQRFFGSMGFMYGLGLDKLEIEEFSTDRRYIELVMTYKRGLYSFYEKSLLTEIPIFSDDVLLYNQVSSLVPVKYTNKNLQFIKFSSSEQLEILSKQFDYRRN